MKSAFNRMRYIDSENELRRLLQIDLLKDIMSYEENYMK